MKKFYKQLHVFVVALLCLLLVLSFVACTPNKDNQNDMDVNIAKTLYQFSEDNNKITITKYIGSQTQIELPSSIGGKQVVAIGNNAFYWCTDLTKITISDEITNIGNHAFDSCTSLTQVVFKENSQLAQLGERAFKNCTSLTSINFKECKNLTTMGDWVLSDCDSLASIVIPDSVENMGYAAFYGCDNLTIYCEAGSQPTTWENTWKIGDRPVYWYSESQPSAQGDFWHYVDGVATVWG